MRPPGCPRHAKDHMSYVSSLLLLMVMPVMKNAPARDERDNVMSNSALTGL